MCEGIVDYVESLRGLASKEVGVEDISRQVSKSVDTAVVIVGFFSAASDAAFEKYNEAGKYRLAAVLANMQQLMLLNDRVATVPMLASTAKS